MAGVELQRRVFELRDGKAKEVIEMMNNQKYPYVDQDTFNYACQGHIRRIPSRYNVTDFTPVTRYPKIIHYAGMRKWGNMDLVKKYAAASWDEIAKYRGRVYGHKGVKSNDFSALLD